MSLVAKLHNLFTGNTPTASFIDCRVDREALGFPDYVDFAETSELLAQVAEEMEAQDNEWGEQNHPLRVDPYADYAHTSDVVPLSAEAYRNMADQWKHINSVRAGLGLLAWDGILLEEVYEALAEEKFDDALTELIQSAAVAIQAAKSFRRNDSINGVL